MTMRITKDQKIAGIVAIGVRNVLQKVYDDSSFNEQWLAEEIYWLRTKGQFKYTTRRDCLHWLHSKDAKTYTHYPACRRYWNASLRAAPQLIETLIQQGFIRLNEKETNERKLPRYELTDDGREFRRATAAKPVHRKKADEAIKGLMERVRIVNEDDLFLYRVTTVVLYGSYVRGAERPADVDLAIDVKRKICDVKKFHEACWKHLNDSGRESRRIGYEFDFPRDEVFVFLRQRKRTLSLHALHDFIGMEKHENFSYDVLFGDKNATSQMLGEPQGG
jgi:predicted nucleotidyltransferase